MIIDHIFIQTYTLIKDMQIPFFCTIEQ